MWKTLVFTLTIAVANAQVPSLGWCPDYQAMANFNLNRFLGVWHEAERYFTITELGSRCVTTNYEKQSDGRIIVFNEIKGALTGVKRVVEGQLQHVGRDGEGKIVVKYKTLPVPYDTQYTILDTDYDTYAVMWSCSGIGPVHTQNAWVMTRERLAPGLVLQRAYGVLDKFKISRAFFVKTSQEDCTIQAPAIETIDPTPAPASPAPAITLETKSVADNQPESIPEEVPETEKEEVLPSVKAAINDEKIIKDEVPAVENPQPAINSIVPEAELKSDLIEADNPIANALKSSPVEEKHEVASAENVVPSENPKPLVKSIVDEVEPVESTNKEVSPPRPEHSVDQEPLQLKSINKVEKVEQVLNEAAHKEQKIDKPEVVESKPSS